MKITRILLAIVFAGSAIAAGSGSLFVQQYVKHDGHCAILPNEIARGFDELRAWATNGTKPSAGLTQ